MTCTVLLTAPVMLAGCGGGTQVEFEGKLFEAVGLSGQTQYKEPTVPERSPLLLPPEKRQAELPEPGVRQAAAQPEVWPTDPDIERARQLAEAKAKEKRECDNWAFENKKTSVEDFEKVQNPSTRCKGWLGNAFKNKDSRADGSPDTVSDFSQNADNRKKR
ncbi:MAG: hypothetical protein AB7U38_06605 [Hyphomicrobiales bacterium]